MIKIINGTYGMRIGKQVKPINSSHPPISLSAEEETRLVNLGIAIKVEQTDTEKPTVEEDLTSNVINIDALKRMSIDKLKAMANESGIVIPKGVKKKDDIINVILAAGDSVENDIETDDADAPVFDAELPQ